jgi:uncharacterized protein (DUF2141 family)
MKIIALMIVGLAVTPSFGWDGGWLRMPSAKEISSMIVPSAEAAPVKAASGAELIVTVDRFTVRNNAPVIFSICDSARCHDLQDKGYKDIPAVLLETGAAGRKYKISGLKPGEYSLTGYNDLNNNKTLDKGMFGIPKEPIGFSRLDVEKISANPRWDEIRFTVAEAGSRVTVHLVHKFGL